MADIDIDKMLEQSEKKEKEKKAKSMISNLVIAGGGAAMLIIAAIIIIMLVAGEPGSSYFPTDTGMKYLYNKKGKNPEERSFLGKKENLYGYECSVLNIVDKGSYTTRQEYYCYDKEKGYARLAYSDNHGMITKDVFVILPNIIKEGRQWNAGIFKGSVVKAQITGREKMMTPEGTLETIVVEYKAIPYMDLTVWYAKDLGVIKEKNNLTADETSLISSGE
jgi:hypothetical protein